MVPSRILLGVALTSLATIALELALTRLFSATMFYHFAFLAISLALFGSGAGGVALYALRDRFPRERASVHLAVCAVLFAASVVLALYVILDNPIPAALPGLHLVGPLSLVYGAAALPFFFAGLTISLAIDAWARGMSRLYLFDLAGAALGCLLLVPALDALGAVDTVLAVALVAALASFVFAGGGAGPRVRAVAALAPAAAGGLLLSNHQSRHLDIREAKGLREDGVVFSKWNSFSRVTVGRTADPDRHLIFIDADAATALLRDASDLDKHRAEGDRVEALAYHVAPRKKVLIIGPGGGVDVVIARLFGARDITAVEVNPLVARDVMLEEPFLSYSGRLYRQPGVRLEVDEARSFIRRSRERYDLVLGTMVDTWAATAAGAFALTENNLYTVEAFRDYLAHLTDGGVLSLTRWYQQPPDQLLRLMSLARAAMSEVGISDPSRHLLLMRGAPHGSGLATGTLLLKKSAFTDEECRSADEFAARTGYEVLYSPTRRPESDFKRLAEADDPREVWDSLKSDVTPTRDDSPFFFQSVRLERLFRPRLAQGEWAKTSLGTTVLVTLVGISAIVVVLFVLGPLLLVRRRLGGSPRPGRMLLLLYFGCLGLAFVLIEVALVQKSVLFLGHPVYALTIVLFSILLSSAAGSALSGQLTLLVPALRRVLPAIAVLVVAYVLLLPVVFYGFVHLEAPVRMGLAVLVIAPLGVLMGVPMPTGIRLLAGYAPALVPWAWGVNGAASVLGSAGAVALAMMAGFNATLLTGAIFYLLALVCVIRAQRASASVLCSSLPSISRGPPKRHT
jgi:spermidine synthase